MSRKLDFTKKMWKFDDEEGGYCLKFGKEFAFPLQVFCGSFPHFSPCAMVGSLPDIPGGAAATVAVVVTSDESPSICLRAHRPFDGVAIYRHYEDPDEDKEP
jgi:hypothetical protein